MSLKSFIENNNQKIIIYLIIYLLVPAALNTFTVMFSDKFLDNILTGITRLFFTYVGMILFFIPTYIILYFLFKKIKKKNIKYLLFSISIPFTIFIYFLINK